MQLPIRHEGKRRILLTFALLRIANCNVAKSRLRVSYDGSRVGELE